MAYVVICDNCKRNIFIFKKNPKVNQIEINNDKIFHLCNVCYNDYIYYRFIKEKHPIYETRDLLDLGLEPIYFAHLEKAGFYYIDQISDTKFIDLIKNKYLTKKTVLSTIMLFKKHHLKFPDTDGLTFDEIDDLYTKCKKEINNGLNKKM